MSRIRHACRVFNVSQFRKLAAPLDGTRLGYRPDEKKIM